ncbi:MAG TPA: maleylpyruvate isomerase N-terminal domain-containing protein [candidate division Zixibacteria bacterium]|nr:maleylpyruvate isomerase N-terminal domain-containing protein [candidate division Zixibacteria bacterium]
MTLERDASDVRALLDELRAARTEFLAALDDVDPALLTTPGLVGDWSARELLAHLGYWAGHAAEAVHHATQGRLHEFGADELDVDQRNAIVARVAAETDMATVRRREAAAYQALVDGLETLDPAWLEERSSYGDSLETIVRDDGTDHYREHTLDLRAWFSGSDAGATDDEDADVEDVDQA